MKHYFILLFCLSFLSSNGQDFYQYLVENPEASYEQIKTDMDAYYENRDKGRGTGYKQYQRWLISQRPYLTPGITIKNQQAMITQEYGRWSKTQPISTTDRSVHGDWSFEGPFNYTDGNGWNPGVGRINRIFFHPTTSDVFWACSPAGGLWRTQNGGSTWKVLTDKLPRIGAAGFATDPGSFNIQYLLTGDSDGADVYSIGLLKSTDGGLNWSQTGLTFSESSSVRATDLIMHPTNFDTLYVTSSIGILVTHDQGASWDTVETGFFNDIEFQPGNPARMYASGHWGRFFVSNDSGNTWNQISDSDFPGGNNRVEIGVTPADSSYVYLIFGGQKTGTGTFPGFFRSTDAGANFTERSTTPNILGYETLGNDNEEQGHYDLAIVVDPDDEDVVFIAGINVWKSDNGGTSWSAKSYWTTTLNLTGYCHADVHDLGWNGDDLFVASDGGVFKSTNNGDDWTDLSEGLGIMQFYDFDVVNGIIAGGTQDNGSNQWVTGSTTATHTLGADGFAARTDPSDTNIRYQTTQEDLHRSNNAGGSFPTKNVPGETNYWTVDLELNRQNPDTLYIGFHHIYRSFDQANNWDSIGTLGSEIISMYQAHDDVDRMYVASSNGTFLRSDNINDVSPDWLNRTGTLPIFQANMSDIAVDPDDSERLWVSFAGFNANHKVYMSSDTGWTWTNVTNGIPNVPVRCLVSEPGSNNGVYAGTDVGIFYRNDQIGKWIYYSNEMPVTPVTQLRIDQNKLYAATFGRGIWSSDLYTSCINGIILTQSDPGNGKWVYHTLDFLTSNQIITGGLGTDIQYYSENQVKLTTGFHARANNNFVAKLEDCPQ